MIKVLIFMFVFVWLRGTLPRLRYDQFMHLGWKVLVPVSLAWIVLIGTARVLNSTTSLSTRDVLLIMGIPLVVILLAIAFWPSKDEVIDEEDTDLELPPQPGVVGPSLADFPVPPIDLVIPIPPIRRRAAVMAGATVAPASGAGQPVTAPITGDSSSRSEQGTSEKRTSEQGTGGSDVVS
jgi:NADH-quinone oxidoreductase subunit H